MDTTAGLHYYTIYNVPWDIPENIGMRWNYSLVRIQVNGSIYFQSAYEYSVSIYKQNKKEPKTNSLYISGRIDCCSRHFWIH